MSEKRETRGKEPERERQNIWLSHRPVCAVVAAALVAAMSITAAGGGGEEAVVKGEPDPVELAKPGALPDMSIGKPGRPQHHHRICLDDLPALRPVPERRLSRAQGEIYRHGRARIIFREFPLDNLAVAGLHARALRRGRPLLPMVDGLFETQEVWAVRGPEGKDKLDQIARQAGFSKESFDKCLGDKALFRRSSTSASAPRFGVDSTPTFFINAKRMTGDHQLSDFEAMIGVEVGAARRPPTASAPPAERDAAECNARPSRKRAPAPNRLGRASPVRRRNSEQIHAKRPALQWRLLARLVLAACGGVAGGRQPRRPRRPSRRAGADVMPAGPLGDRVMGNRMPRSPSSNMPRSPARIAPISSATSSRG